MTAHFQPYPWLIHLHTPDRHARPRHAAITLPNPARGILLAIVLDALLWAAIQVIGRSG